MSNSCGEDSESFSADKLFNEKFAEGMTNCKINMNTCVSLHTFPTGATQTLITLSYNPDELF
jgi:hypothetical protein